MRIRTPREKRIFIFKTAVRWFIYLLITLICFIFLTSGTFLKPILLIPIAICISANSQEIPSAFTGIICGFLIDIACGKLFGYNAIILMVICVLSSLIFNNYLKLRLTNILIITTVSSLIQGFLDYKFYYDIWDYENSNVIFSSIILPICFFTILSAIPIYFIIKLIDKWLMPKHHLSIEEVIKTNQEKYE